MENSNCQSLGLFFKAAAYEGLGGEAFEPEADGPGAELGLGVATRVPSGVCATTFDPSAKPINIVTIFAILKTYLRRLTM